MQEQRQERKLTTIRNISKEQVLLTGSALLASGVLDVASHSGAALYFGTAAAVCVGYNSRKILDWLVPGGDPETVVAQTSQIVEAISPEGEDDPYKDQRPMAKLKRMVGMRTPPLEQPCLKTSSTSENEVQESVQDDDFSVDLTTHMDFGPTLRPDANKVFSGRKVLFGVSDAGKSNNVAVILEEYGRFGAPLFLFDTEGEYKALVNKAYFPSGIHVTREKIKPDEAYNFGQWALQNLKQVVLDLSTYSDSEAAWLMIGIIKGVKDFEESHEVRLPCEIILDEATVWLPQNQNQSSLSKVMVDDPDGESVDDEGRPKPVTLLTLLERAFFSIVVRRGRKRGMGFTLATQRPAELNKSAVSASWMILMRQTQAADFKVYKEFGITPEMALSLKQGEAFVFAPGQTMEQHQFRKRRSPHGAATPGLAELRQHQRRAAAQPAQTWNGVQVSRPVPVPQTTLLAEEDVDALLDEVRNRPDVDPDDRRYAQPVAAPLPVIRKSDPRKATLADAIEVWNDCGGNIGRQVMENELIARDFACGPNLARTFIEEIKKRIEDQ